MVYLKEKKKVPTKATKITNKNPGSEKVLSQIKPLPPLAYPSNRILMHPEMNHVDLYQI